MRDVATRICREYLSGAWKTISSDEIQVKRIRWELELRRNLNKINLWSRSGGLSNFLYYVSLPSSKKDVVTGAISTKRTRKDSYHNQLMESAPCSVLLRIYGQTHGEHALETMLTESVVFTLLSERQLGPKLHGIFPGGRIEQYIPVRFVHFETRDQTEDRFKFTQSDEFRCVIKFTFSYFIQLMQRWRIIFFFNFRRAHWRPTSWQTTKSHWKSPRKWAKSIA